MPASPGRTGPCPDAPAGLETPTGPTGPADPAAAGASTASSTLSTAAAAGPALVIVGPPGAGKTTAGQLVAASLGLPFRDTDADVEAAAGMPVADIFVDEGEESFRALERAAVARALAEHRGVLALGGGAVLDPATRAALVGRFVVHLDVGVPEAAKRVGLARDRPLLVEAPRSRLGAMLRERAPLYAEVATVVVDTRGRTPDEVADAVLAAVPADTR